MDRVVHCSRRVTRTWPTTKGWTYEELKQREEAEGEKFGRGRLEDRIDKERCIQEEEQRRLEGLNRRQGGGPSVNRAKRIRDRFIASSKKLAEAVVTWVDDF